MWGVVADIVFCSMGLVFALVNLLRVIQLLRDQDFLMNCFAALHFVAAAFAAWACVNRIQLRRMRKNRDFIADLWRFCGQDKAKLVEAAKNDTR